LFISVLLFEIILLTECHKLGNGFPSEFVVIFFCASLQAKGSWSSLFKLSFLN